MVLYGFEENKEVLAGKKFFLVCGKSFDGLTFAGEIMKYSPVRFGEFHSNPLLEEALKGVEIFKASDCDAILAVGGGSAMDVAKCIKYYSRSNKPIIAIPTTAGTGSESTHFAVIYKDGVKLSVEAPSLLPEISILEPSVLKNVPDYTRKATMLDALCHAIESYWARKATKESRNFSTQAIAQILENKDSYLKNKPEGNAGMLRAANLAGKAINLTTTTAAHAMCYKITSMYGFAHGHAVALCLPEVWKYNDIRVPGITVEEFESLFAELHLERPKVKSLNEEIQTLVSSVNLERLGNNPIALSQETIKEMYMRILK